MPPTEDEKVQFHQIRSISKYFIQKLSTINGLFLSGGTLAEELRVFSNCFANFQRVLDALPILRKYTLATRFLEELNHNTWFVANA